MLSLTLNREFHSGVTNRVCHGLHVQGSASLEVVFSFVLSFFFLFFVNSNSILTLNIKNQSIFCHFSFFLIRFLISGQHLRHAKVSSLLVIAQQF